jgi:hypothetical protein
MQAIQRCQHSYLIAAARGAVRRRAGVSLQLGVGLQTRGRAPIRAVCLRHDE